MTGGGILYGGATTAKNTWTGTGEKNSGRTRDRTIDDLVRMDAKRSKVMVSDRIRQISRLSRCFVYPSSLKSYHAIYQYFSHQIPSTGQLPQGTVRQGIFRVNPDATLLNQGRPPESPNVKRRRGKVATPNKYPLKRQLMIIHRRKYSP